MKKNSTKETKHNVLSISQQLDKDEYVFIKGEKISQMMCSSVSEVLMFKKCWDFLERDRYMADSGTYRYRRYGQFTKLAKAKEVIMMPHEPYTQPSYINSLNGDIQRYFEPLTANFVSSPVLKKLLGLMCEIYDHAEGASNNWNIRLHPYRITTSKMQAGKPTPEGLHRDGVTYIASMLIRKSNIVGGETVITDTKKNELARITLEMSFDIIMADDATTMHEVSTIYPINIEEAALRDVLVIAFTKLEN